MITQKQRDDFHKKLIYEEEKRVLTQDILCRISEIYKLINISEQAPQSVIKEKLKVARKKLSELSLCLRENKDFVFIPDQNKNLNVKTTWVKTPVIREK